MKNDSRICNKIDVKITYHKIFRWIIALSEPGTIGSIVLRENLFHYIMENLPSLKGEIFSFKSSNWQKFLVPKIEMSSLKVEIPIIKEKILV